MIFENDKAYLLAIEYMRGNHMKAVRHSDYYRLFCQAYESFNGYMSANNSVEQVKSNFSIPNLLLKKVND